MQSWLFSISMVCSIVCSGLALVLSLAVVQKIHRLEQDTWTVLPTMVRSTCIMDKAAANVRGRFVVASTRTPKHCFIAQPGGYPKRMVLGIMLDDAAVAGEPAMLLTPSD